MVRWEILERIGAYVAGELSGKQAREAERLILEEEDPEALRLAESYARLLAFLSAVGREPPMPPRAIAEHVLRWAADDDDVGACGPREAGEGDRRKAGREHARKEGRRSDG